VRVAEQNLELIASWLANECGQTSHARSARWVGGWATGKDVMDVGGTARGIVAQT
jgi:hypothetical protein